MKTDIAYANLKADIELLSFMVQCRGSNNIFGFKTVKRGDVTYIIEMSNEILKLI